MKAYFESRGISSSSIDPRAAGPAGSHSSFELPQIFMLVGDSHVEGVVRNIGEVFEGRELSVGVKISDTTDDEVQMKYALLIAQGYLPISFKALDKSDIYEAQILVIDNEISNVSLPLHVQSSRSQDKSR